jgi:hypothetical protein
LGKRGERKNLPLYRLYVLQTGTVVVSDVLAFAGSLVRACNYPKNGNSATENTEEHRENKGLHQIFAFTFWVAPTNSSSC